MTSSTDNPRKHFDELVPFYLTGRIAQSDREWVDRYLATHPEAQAELDWHRDLMTEVVGKAEARAMQAPEMVGWARVESELRLARKVAPTSFVDRLNGWLGWLSSKPVAAMAAALIVVQGAMIGTLLNRAPADVTEPIRTMSTAAARDVLQVRFKQAATEHELRTLLYGAGARIVDGPDQLGDYVVEPRRGALAALQAELGRSELVQSVSPLKAWKAEPRDEQ
jgi:hypothetical protein